MPPETPSEAFRLPTTVRPSRYDIHLTAHPSEPVFQGEVGIDVTLDEPTNQVTLHAKELEVAEAAVERDGDRTVGHVETDEANETVTLVFPKTIPAGPARLGIRYRGEVGQSMVGLYHSKDGDEECLATQCEATDARRVFPCFDEPAFKAQIAWRVTTKDDVHVLANGPLAEKVEADDGQNTWIFEATPPISSYLAAVAIGAFGATDPVEARGTPFHVWALGGKERLGTHARDFAGRLLPWYEDYFGADYAFGKYDQLAVPSFSFGAMENVGLVVFRASLLLTDPKTTSWQAMKTIDMVVAHEFAHMWFGNLVTMAWWDDLWLNEAFAEWVAHKAVDELEPSHEVWHDFQDRTFSALDTDALTSTHAIYNEVATPEEAREMFDAITYGKGSAVLRMLESYLGEDAFRDGLQSYMAEFGTKNARGADLWRHMATSSDEPVGEIMQDWVGQPGHPVVRVETETVGDGIALNLKQSRARSGTAKPKSDQTWRVPLRIRWRDSGGTHEARHLLAEPADTARIAVEGDFEWLVANADDLGFYRLDYEPALREKFLAHAADATPTERTGFLRDQWGLVREGRLPIADFLDAVSVLAVGDDHHTVVDYVVNVVRGVERMLEHADDADALSAYRRWVADRFRAPLDELGFEPGDDEPPTERKRRATLVRAVAAIGREDETVGRALELASREQEDAASVDANLAGLVVGIAAQQGDPERFDANLATYRARRDAHAAPQEVDRYLYSFAAFREPDLVGRTLQLLADGTVPNQSIGPLLRALLAEPHGQRAAWAFLKEKWEEIHGKVGNAWIAILVESAGYLPPDLAEDVEATFDEKLDGVASQSRRRAAERLADRKDLYGRVLADLVSWARGLAAVSDAPKAA